jgi:hypothetical protein
MPGNAGLPAKIVLMTSTDFNKDSSERLDKRNGTKQLRLVKAFFSWHF